MACILIVDDERDIRLMLTAYFTRHGYRVCCAQNGEEALALLPGEIDLILLDIGLPGMDGLALCRQVRDLVACPILFLTARAEDGDKVTALGMGGDDYIVKPFSLAELLARVEAHLRREERRAGRPAAARFDTDLRIHFGEKAVYGPGGQRIPLARKEFEILEFLAVNAGLLFDKERIYERLWGFDSEGDSAVVSEHIRRIRAKLSAAGCKNHIETAWGMGYKWVR